MFKLIVTAGPDKGLAFSLNPGETLQIGRSQAASNRLSDPAVSRVHCEIEATGGKAVLHNISANGTVVNGEPATERVLQHGDIIRLGNSELSFASAEAGEASTAMIPPPPGAAAPLVTPLAEPAGMVGKAVSHYQIESLIARGTIGTVYKARDTRDGSVAALKVLQPEFSQSEEEMQRFVRAMKTMLPVRHPNIVQIIAAGKTGAQTCWIAMEYVDGESLTKVIQRIGIANMLDWKHAFRVAVHIGQALDYAHGQSIIHRNVTPPNILLRTSDKAAKLGDLMLAKALEGVMAKDVTKPGELVGDIAYMAPERTTGAGAVDGRSDLYGLGATLYAMLTGRPPFSGNSLPEVIIKIRSAEPKKPKEFQLSIPDLFQGTVLKLLAKRPGDRHQTAAELLDDLKRVGRFAGVTV